MSTAIITAFPTSAFPTNAGTAPRTASMTRTASAARSVPTTPRLRITRRGRAVLSFAVALPLVVGIGFAVLNGGGAIATSSSSSQSYEYVMVEPGQSLWQIAELTAPQADPRDFISDVARLNQLGSLELQAGDRLAIPAKYSD